MSSKALNLSAKDLTNYLQQLYSKAPASVLTFSSLLLSYLFTVSINDYRLWMSIGPGGFLKKNLIGWVAHSFLRLLGLSASQVKEANWLPQPSSKDTNQLKNLKQREGERPQVFGVVPHRQIEDLMAEGDPMKQVSLEQREGGQVDVHSEISLLLSLSLLESALRKLSHTFNKLDHLLQVSNVQDPYSKTILLQLCSRIQPRVLPLLSRTSIFLVLKENSVMFICMTVLFTSSLLLPMLESS